MGESPSSALPQLTGLTIEAVEWLPSGADSGLVRVRGRWSASEAARPGLPELVVRSGEAEHRFESLPDARFARDAASWRGSYLVPVALVASEHEALWIEWPGGVRSGLPALSPGPASPAAVAEPARHDEGGQLIDRGVLAERRARRAEAGEQAQARVAAEALRAVEALELRSAELERRLAEVSAERDELAAGAVAAPEAPPAADEAELERRQAALTAALESLATLRRQTREWRLKLRTAEIERAADAARVAVLERRRLGEQAVLQTRVADLEAALASTEAKLKTESVARIALEDELDRNRDARAELAEERSARAAVTAELAEARKSFAAELEAERAARAAERDALTVLRHEQGRAAAERDSLHDRIAELDRRAAGLADEVRLEHAAREQAEAAAAAARRPPDESARVVADLDAAAAALRAAQPPTTTRQTGPSEVAETAVPAAAPPERPKPTIISATAKPPRLDAAGRSARQDPALRGAIVKLAHDDPVAAGQLLAALLPAHGAALAEALDYDLTIREVGTFAVSVTPENTQVRQIAQRRPRDQADLHLIADALTLAELLAGVPRRVGRMFGPARFRGSRRRLSVLKALPATSLSIAEAARAGAQIAPGLVYRALSYAVHPSWTDGQRFTVAQEITGEAPETWYLTARDGAGLAVSDRAPQEGADATVRMTAEAFSHLLRGEIPPRGQRPAVRGDVSAVERVRSWTDRAQGL